MSSYETMESSGLSAGQRCGASRATTLAHAAAALRRRVNPRVGGRAAVGFYCVYGAASRGPHRHFPRHILTPPPVCFIRRITNELHRGGWLE
jgi:hypothetical protein